LTEYYDTAKKNIGWVPKKLMEDTSIVNKPYYPNIIYNSFGLLTEFLNVVGGNIEKLNQLIKDNESAFDKYKEANRLRREAEKERDAA
jgi:hypothetical protein